MTIPSFTIRRLGPADLTEIRALNAMFGEVFSDPATYGDAPPDDAYFQGLLAKDHIAVLVALAEGRIVGGLVAYEFDKFERARREVYIYDLAVAAGYRRQGIATALIARLGELAASRGAWVMSVQADHGDEPAIALYGKLGEREDVLHFDIAVGTWGRALTPADGRAGPDQVHSAHGPCREPDQTGSLASSAASRPTTALRLAAPSARRRATSPALIEPTRPGPE